jgi:Lectin C-type domain
LKSLEFVHCFEFLLDSGNVRRQYYVTKYLKKNWYEASDYCQYHGMTLATFESKQQADFFTNNSGVDVWVGVNDIAKEGSFIQVDGVTTPELPWRKGSPTDGGSNQDCVQAGYYTYFFTDQNCLDKMMFACQIKTTIV